MDRIAFIIGDSFLYWNSIILTLAAAVAICFFLAFYLGKGGRGAAAAATVPLAMVLSIVLARLLHWYFRRDAYTGFIAAMTDFTTGGYALVGVFVGCTIAAAITRILQIHKNLPGMLDAMSIAAAAGIAVGRLSCFFSAADRGRLMEKFTSLPWAYPVTNVVTGAPEYRLATFLIQAMVCGVIFLILVPFFLRSRRKGNTALLFLLLYGASQVVLDSTRYDSLFMRSNGFIGIVQVLGAVAVAFVCVVLCIRLVKARGFHVWHVFLWLAMAGLMGGAGYMEYYVQRHGDLAVFSYSVMSLCLGLIVMLALIAFVNSGTRQEN